MDMQGTPIGGTSQGTKVTSQNTTTEPTGAVTSDSLAAESANSGGAFSANRNAGAPLSVAGADSTFANTDTAAATTLPPAPDAQARDEQAGYTETGGGQGQGQKFPEAAGGQPDFGGRHSLEGYVGGPSASSESGTGTEGKGASGGTSASVTSTSTSTSTAPASTSAPSSASTGGQTNVDAAPSYIQPVITGAGSGAKPHGTNLTEGGFDASEAKNASFDSEIGGKNDPGRVAEREFERVNESVAGNTGPREGGQGKGTGVYDGLGGDERL